jgi:hypothetical protein
MGMKNLPIDTRCKRIITRGGRRLDAWLEHSCPAEDKEAFVLLIERITAVGGKNMWVGETYDEHGVERLVSFIVPMLGTHNKDAKLKGVVTAIETELAIDDPGTEVGTTWAHVRVRP